MRDSISRRHAEWHILAPGTEAHGSTTKEHDDQPPETALQFSVAGVQLKFSVIMEAAGGLTVPVDGMGGSWIVKLSSAFVMLA
jgi:hypothetical protein